MISLELNNVLIVNNTDTMNSSIRMFIIKEAFSSIKLLEKNIITNDESIPIDTQPAETAEEFIEFLEKLREND